MDNAFAAVADVAGLQRICDELGPAQIQALLDKWQAILPNPFTAADRAAGYDYDLSLLQTEFSLTQKLDTPVSGRVFLLDAPARVVHGARGLRCARLPCNACGCDAMRCGAVLLS